MKTVFIPRTTSNILNAFGPGHYKTDYVLRLAGTYRRFGLGGWTAEGKGRKESGGPEIAGPVAYTYGLATVIAAEPGRGTGAESRRKTAEGTEIEVSGGDIVEVGGSSYRVRVVRGEFLELDLLRHEWNTVNREVHAPEELSVDDLVEEIRVALLGLDENTLVSLARAIDDRNYRAAGAVVQAALETLDLAAREQK